MKPYIQCVYLNYLSNKIWGFKIKEWSEIKKKIKFKKYDGINNGQIEFIGIKNG